MKKVLSIAISSLLVGNFAYADTPNEDLLVTIQKKIEARKSGLGSDVQTSSGLASVNKPKAVTTEIKDSSSTVNLPVKNVSSDKKEEVLTADKKEIKIENNKSSPVLVKNNIEKSVNDIPLNTVVKPNTPENCETPKVKVVKHTVKKSKPVVKNTKPLKNDFEMYKTKNYTPLDFSEKKNNWMTNQQVKISISGEKNDINVNISDLNDKAISSEQLNNLNLRVVQVPQDFSGIYNQIKLLDSNSINYSFDKK